MTLQKRALTRPVSEIHDDLAAKTNLPRGTSFIVGRCAELREISANFDAGARLVTLTGAGGIGKTRLAMRFAEEHVAWYAAPGAGGTWVVDLRGRVDTASLCAGVAWALGISCHGERACEEHVGRVLSRRGQILLVFDGLERLMDGARHTLERWLRAAPGARILATSRDPLGVDGEVQYPLSPLALPDAGTSVAAFHAVDSVEMFVVRALLASPGLIVRPEDYVDIADVVCRLHGIPLAIELSAAWTMACSMPAICERVRRLELCVTQDDAGNARLLRQVIVAACAQLDEVEEVCLLASSVFVGGFTLAAIEAVMSTSDPSVLAAVATLHGCSLIRATRIPEFGGELRFSLHATVHEYAAERLAARPALAATLAGRHAQFYADAGRALVRRVTVEGPAAWLGHELENMRAAHTFALSDPSPGSVGRALELALAADLVLGRRGPVELRWRLLDQALMVANEILNLTVITARLARGRASLELGRVHEARADFEAGLVMAHGAGSEQHKASAHLRRGELAAIHGLFAEARESFVCARSHVFVAWGPVARLCKAEVHACLARVHCREGDRDAAVGEIRAAIAAYRTTNHAEGLAAALHEAAVMLMAQRRHDDALILIDEAVVVAQGVGAHRTVGALLVARGAHQEARGNSDLALEHFVRAAELLQSAGDREREVEALYGLVRVLVERGQRDDARRVVERALSLCVPLEGDGLAIRMELMNRLLPVADAHTGRMIRLALEAALSRKPGDGADNPGLVPLRIRAGARAFRPPHALHDIQLHRHVALCRILLALVRRRVDAPGERLAVDEIFAAGWPGERLGEIGRADRVRVALTALRNLGLRNFLVHGPAGYALTLLCPCELEESN